jgi:ABC-2 type transport system ATP-binding protein
MLEARALSFRYRTWRSRPVFDNLDWRVPPGEKTLLLGPNGVGKSTLIRLLAGMERPRGGAVLLEGVRSDRRALFDRVAWMPQQIEAARDLTALEQIEYAAWAAGLSSRDARRAAGTALERVLLSDKAGMRADRLSGGQLRRLGLAQACVRPGSVLLLDEPTTGLDPAQAANFRHLLSDLEYPGGIVISSHQANELAGLVDRIVVLTHGRIRFDGTIATFRAQAPLVRSKTPSIEDVFTAMVEGGLH